jgi:hypothetical protein
LVTYCANYKIDDKLRNPKQCEGEKRGDQPEA